MANSSIPPATLLDGAIITRPDKRDAIWSVDSARRVLENQNRYLRGYIAHSELLCIHCGKPKGFETECDVGGQKCARRADMLNMLPPVV